MTYSLISNSCISSFLYRSYQPNLHPLFVNYLTPFTSSWFPEDEQYIRFCEKYEYYISLDPIFGPPAACSSWERDTNSKKHIDPAFSSDYIVMHLGNIEIHWIHDLNSELLFKKYTERMIISKKYEKIFLWSDPEMFNIHTKEERKNLLIRFNSIPNKTIFLTKYREEEQYDTNKIIMFVPEWEGKSQYDRISHNFLIKWYDHPTLVNLFNKCIYYFNEDNYNNI